MYSTSSTTCACHTTSSPAAPRRAAPRAGMAIAFLLCIAFSIVAPVFDADEDESWSAGALRYALQCWKWLLVGGGWGLLAAGVAIYRSE